MPEPCDFRLFTVARRGFCRPTRKFDLAPHPIVGLPLQEGGAKKFPQALCFRRLQKNGLKKEGWSLVRLVFDHEFHRMGGLLLNLELDFFDTVSRFGLSLMNRMIYY